MTSVKILADSVNPAGHRLTSWLLTYPRYIHAEFMTHRVFSRNAASSRAIPFAKMRKMIEENPAFPSRWVSERPGMQGGDEIEDVTCFGGAKDVWLQGLQFEAARASSLQCLGLHKSICNRLIEPWMHITVLATATDHRNFFALRAHPAAESTFQELAFKMLEQYLSEEPQKLNWGEWHVPHFENTESRDRKLLKIGDNFLKIATARCARLSYLTFDGEHSPEKDIEIHDKLVSAGHWSPFEHCAQAISSVDRGEFKAYPWSNFDNYNEGVQSSGWGQYRKLFENENRTNVDLHEILKSKPEWIK